VLATVQTPKHAFQAEWLQHHWTFFLDNIQDPGNMGTILRIADWFGLAWVCGSNNCVDIYNPKVVQASMGAIFRVKFAEVDLENISTTMKDLLILGASMSGENIFQKKLEPRGLIIIGNEGQGISEAVKPFITSSISIPRAPNGGAESLIAGVSAGIIAAVMASEAKETKR